MCHKTSRAPGAIDRTWSWKRARRASGTCVAARCGKRPQPHKHRTRCSQTWLRNGLPRNVGTLRCWLLPQYQASTRNMAIHRWTGNPHDKALQEFPMESSAPAGEWTSSNPGRHVPDSQVSLPCSSTPPNEFSLPAWPNLANFMVDKMTACQGVTVKTRNP